MNCNSIRERLARLNRLVIVHHWDSDGIASAAMVTGWLMRQNPIEINYSIPRIGFYDLDAVRSQLDRAVDKADSILFLDYSLRREELEVLEKLTGKDILVVDHHRGDLWKNICNPLLEGYAEEDFPSNTYNLWKNIIQEEVTEHIIHVLIGVVGDLGWKARSFIDHILSRSKVIKPNLEKLYRIVETIDSCYRVGDFNCIEKARTILVEGNIYEILETPILTKARDNIQNEINNILKSIEALHVNEKTIYFVVESDNYITSYIGRILSIQNKEKIIVLRNYAQRLNLETIYVRSFKHNLSQILSTLKKSGIKHIGGKDYVFAIQCRGRCEEALIDLVLEKIQNTLEGRSDTSVYV